MLHHRYRLVLIRINLQEDAAGENQTQLDNIFTIHMELRLIRRTIESGQLVIILVQL